MKKIISLADIAVDESPKVRAEYRHEIAEEYAEQYRLKRHNMPMPVLFQDATMKEPFCYLIGDGLHRINAMKMAGLKEAVFEIMLGTKQECLRYALQSNVGHGIRRTNADKRHCVALALQEFNGLSLGVIADCCAVAKSFVWEVQQEMKASLPPPAKRTGVDGVQRASHRSPRTVETQETKEISENTSEVPAEPTVPPTSEVDETGYPVPDKALLVWSRRSQASPLVSAVEALRDDINQAAVAKDPLFAEVNFKMLTADLANVRGQLLLAVPYAVCPACAGLLPETCNMCLKKGVVSKWRYETSPIEIRKMRGG